jgi:hypothetical protein
MAKTIRLTESDLSLIVRRVIKEQNQADIQNIRRVLVDTGKISEKDFEEIITVSNGKSNYIKLLAKALAKGYMENTDIYKWGPQKDKFIGQFEKAKDSPTTKALFPIKDIGRINTKQEFDEFQKTIKDYIERDVKTKFKDSDEFDPDSILLDQTDMLKLESVGIEFLDLVAGYQIFKVSNMNKETWEVYRTILGRCKEGAPIHICTIAGYSHFKNYLEKHPGSSYYVIFNQNDPLSPYQFHYESNQFKDRKDADVF